MTENTTLLQHEVKRLQIAERDQAPMPAQFVGFQCFVCGERHADLLTLEDCHKRKQFENASAVMLQLVTA